MAVQHRTEKKGQRQTQADQILAHQGRHKHPWHMARDSRKDTNTQRMFHREEKKREITYAEKTLSTSIKEKETHWLK